MKLSYTVIQTEGDWLFIYKHYKQTDYVLNTEIEMSPEVYSQGVIIMWYRVISDHQKWYVSALLQ